MSDVAAIAEVLRPGLLRLSRRLRSEAQRAGVSAVDAQLLGLIAKKPGIGVSELAAIEQVSRPSMSAHVKRLEAAGWIGRQPAAGRDQRRARLMLADAGREALLAIRRSRNDWLATQLALLTDAERAALAAATAAITRLAEMRS